VVQQILQLLHRYCQLVDSIPAAAEGKSRFGNIAFRHWLDAAGATCARDMATIGTAAGVTLPDDACAEIAAYLMASFGDYTRIDYGTGHEAHFIAWLYCWKRLGLLGTADYTALVTRVFERYIFVMRQLQFKYWLEPAGSHGVWGLDDYHFLPFLFGSAQLAPFAHMKPKAIHDPEYVAQMADDFLYFACIKFINTVKTSVSLRWHSPMLDDISGVRSWRKVNEGMIKMYRADVLGKLPIMQHMLFGSILPLPDRAADQQQLDEQHDDCAGGLHPHHAHHHHPSVLLEGEAPSCCPRIPSAISAHQRETFRIPFD
jgi:serine/threonine-protein phosphatase 2A activator